MNNFFAACTCAILSCIITNIHLCLSDQFCCHLGPFPWSPCWMLFAKPPTLPGCVLVFVTGNHFAHDWVLHRACIMLLFDRHVGVLHEGLWCVHHAEGHLLLHGKYLNCTLPTLLHHLHLHLHSCGTLEPDRGICVSILCYGWDLHYSRCVVGGDAAVEAFRAFQCTFNSQFCVCIMVGKSVMQVIVIIGVSLITLCSSTCTCSHVASATLCSSRTGIGLNKLSILLLRNFISPFPLVVWLSNVVAWVNSSVSALRCWWEVKLGNWQCCGNSSVNPDEW